MTLRLALPLLGRLALRRALPLLGLSLGLALRLALRRLRRRVVGHVALPRVAVFYREMTLEAAAHFGYRGRTAIVDSASIQVAIGANRAFAAAARSRGASST